MHNLCTVYKYCASFQYLEGKLRYGLAGKNMDPIFGNIQQD